MKTVNVREVRNKFNDLASKNEELLVLKRGVPIMKLSPVTKEDLMKYYLSKAQEEAKKIGLTEEEGLKILDEIREELKDENSD
ncbi:MAG: toxin-antitoxin (TA) system antitoxin [Kosmotogaceae bacterium]|jgi:antitoxin (DNA-binding transcriptional repressor) of toxin-antitoxin stability system|nr:MAG: toxin-antitoxin (TA) system antitoxin [Kosmotoga sp.]